MDDPTEDEANKPSDGVTYSCKPISRAIQACGNCRRKKIRCSGQHPKCRTCSRLSQVCIYPSGESQRATERVLRVENTDNIKDEVKAKLQVLETRTEDMQATLTKILQAMQQPTTQSIADASSTMRSGATPEMRHMDVQAPWPSLNVSGTDNHASEIAGSISSDPSLFRGLLPFTTVISGIDVYFTYCHNQPYSFFHEATFRQNLADGLIPDHLVFAVLANAVRFSSDPFFSNQPATFAPIYATEAWKIVVSRVFTGGEKPNLATVQSLTLLSIFDFTAGRERHGSAWVKIGMSVRIAQDLRLMMDSPVDAPFSELEERRRTFWSIYILDRLASCGQARPPAILEASCQLQLPCDEQVWRSGLWQKTETLESFSNRQLSDPKDYGPFAMVVLTAYALSRSAQYALQDYNIRSRAPPWDPNSDYSSIHSDLMYLEGHFDFDQDIPQIIRRARGGSEFIDQPRAGPTVFAHAIFFLSNCLLNHPFLIRRRLNLCQAKPSSSFFARTFKYSQDYATKLTLLLSEATESGCIMLTSFYGYCAVVCATVHGFYTSSSDEVEASESLKLLQTCESFLDNLSRYWINCSTIRDIVRPFAMDCSRFKSLVDAANKTALLDATDTAMMWTMLDYSAMSNLPGITSSRLGPSDDSDLMIDDTGQWADLFNSMGTFSNDMPDIVGHADQRLNHAR